MTRRIMPLLLAVALPLAGCAPEPPGLAEPGDMVAEDDPEQEVVIVIAGDLMVHEEQLFAAFDPATGTYDFGPGLAWIAQDLAAADLAVGNLETVFAGEAAGYGGYPRFNTPDSFADALCEAGFDLLSTANNHCLDGGEKGLLRTLEVLDRAGLGHTGTFSSAEEARAAVVEVGGMRIAVAAFTYGVNDLPLARPELVNLLERERGEAVLREAARNADWVIALPHMGEEYAAEPGAVYREWAGFLLDNGADAVLAAHPHVLQPLEWGRAANGERGIIAFSLGNLLAYQPEPPRDAGMLLKLRIVKRGDGPARLREASILPVWTPHRDAAGRVMARVVPIYDAVRDYEDANSLGLRPQDYARLLEAHGEITALYLGEPVSRPGMRREYVLDLAGG